MSLLGLSPDRVVTIGAASNGRFFVPDRTETMPEESRRLLRGVLGITRPFGSPSGTWTTGRTRGA